MIYLGEFNQIGRAWTEVVKYIYSEGYEVVTEDECYKEIKGITLDVFVDGKIDHVVATYGNENSILWMKENFEVLKTVKELGNANSYATRLFNYAGTKNQIEWIIEKIRKKKTVRSATITTFEPLTDVNYIPCISLLDFDVVDEKLDVYVYARALDFGQKAYANLICINDLLMHIADSTKLKPGIIHLICKSAHVYDRDYDLMNKMRCSYGDV